MKNLAIFLAGYVSESSKARYKAMSHKDLEDFKTEIVMRFPVIQGTQNQFDIDKIGQMQPDMSEIRNEVDELLKEYESDYEKPKDKME